MTALGAWLLFAPNIFSLDIRSAAADIAHIGGAIVFVGAVIAMAEVIRALRLVNVAAGLAIAGHVVLTDAGIGYATAMVVTGLASLRHRYPGEASGSAMAVGRSSPVKDRPCSPP